MRGHSERLPPASLPLGKRVAFSVAIAAGVWLVAEAGAFLSFRALDGEFFSFSRVHSEQARLAGSRSVGTPKQVSRSMGPTLRDRLLNLQVVHPYLGFVYDPDSTEASTWGFPDRAAPLKRRSSDRLIVAITGGSLARDLARDALPWLAESLRASEQVAEKKLVFVRLAIAGYKQPQQLATLSYLLSLGAEFDVLINIDGFNEVALHETENAPKSVFPAFPRSWYFRTQALPDPDTHASIGAIHYLGRTRARWAETFEGSILRYSVLGNLAWRARDRRLETSAGQIEAELREQKATRSSYLITGPGRRYRTRDALFRELVGIWRRGSLQLQRLCRANGIRYFHFLQPNQYLAGSKPMGEAERRLALVESNPYGRSAAFGYPRLIEAGSRLRESGVEFKDLTMIFKAVEEPVYSDACCHLNELGQRILTSEIAAFILERL